MHAGTCVGHSQQDARNKPDPCGHVTAADARQTTVCQKTRQSLQKNHKHKQCALAQTGQTMQVARPRATQQYASFHTDQPQPAKPIRLQLRRSRTYNPRQVHSAMVVKSTTTTIGIGLLCAQAHESHYWGQTFGAAAAPTASLPLYESQQGMHVPRSPSRLTSHACQPALAARSPSAIPSTSSSGRHCSRRNPSVNTSSRKKRTARRDKEGPFAAPNKRFTACTLRTCVLDLPRTGRVRTRQGGATVL